MMRRRIVRSAALKEVNLLSTWRGRHSHASRAGDSQAEKKVGGEAGGPHRPRPFRRRGAYSTGRYARGTAIARSRKGPRAGRHMPAAPFGSKASDPESCRSQPLARGTATKRD